MNEINELKKYFPFDIQLIFNIYSDVSRIWGTPSSELIMDIYDSTVQDRLRDVYFDLSSGDVSIREYQPWNINELSSGEFQNLSDLIGTKVILETSELKDVLSVFSMFYFDKYGEAINMPIKGVW